MIKDNKATLLIIDMQNDFINGSLANKDAEAIVPGICDFIKNWEGGGIIVTRDSHEFNYLNTPEGKKLPIEHCLMYTAGWCVDDRIQHALYGHDYIYIDKDTFGSLELVDKRMRYYFENKEVVILGTCTDICVISNALILKNAYPTANIKVLANLCAGTSKENHEAALAVMRSCQIDVIE